MFAGDGSAHVDTNLHQFPPSFSNAHDLVGKTRIKTDEWMQVAVAGVKDVCDSQLILRGNLVSSAEHFGQVRARNDRILDHRVRRDAANGAKRPFPRGPKLLALRFVSRVAAVASAILHANTCDLLCF